MLTTKDAVKKHKITRQWLYDQWKKGNLNLTQNIIRGRVVNFYNDAEIRKIKKQTKPICLAVKGTGYRPKPSRRASKN